MKKSIEIAVLAFSITTLIIKQVTYCAESVSMKACGVMINAIAIDPGRPEVIYTLTPPETSGNSVYRSTDGCDKWNAVDEPFSESSGLFLVIDPKNSQIIYTSRRKSIDGGRTWSIIDYVQGRTSIVSSKFIIHPHKSEILYSLANNGTIYKSINGGASWTIIGDEQLGECKAFALDTNNPNVLYGQYERKSKDVYRREPNILGGIYKSVDGGITWKLQLSSSGIRELIVDPTNSEIIYAVNIQNGVYSSLNGGKQWNGINRGLPERTRVYVLAIDPLNTEKIYAATDRGIFVSEDRGDNWRSCNAGLPNTVSMLAINPQNSAIIYAGTPYNGVFKTTDGGATWNPVNKGLPSLPDCK